MPATILNVNSSPSVPAAASVSSSSNPLLEFQPAYTYSMPTQLLILGIVLTLLTVLLFHLLFTAKYHYPLARCNFILLLSAVILTEISTIILVILTNVYLFDRSRYWPFMFDYIEVTMPRNDWNLVPLGGWYIMQGAVTFLAHATHIQFLTLLFPSSLERKLILAFLGPLCLFASVLFFTHFLSDPNYQDLGDAIRNTATSTLSLLYTFGLLIWGYVVNRKRAWDHEGGTFGFGAISISLALIGTAANFIEVREDRLKWLPWLVNTVLLWQSWAGFWWWVGAGMWLGEVEDIERREEKKRRREEKRQRKRLKMFHLISNLSQPSPRDYGSTTALKTVHTHVDDDEDHLTNLSRSNSTAQASSPSPSTSSRRFPTQRERLQEQADSSHRALEALIPHSTRSADYTKTETHFLSPITESSSSLNDDPSNNNRSGTFSFLQQPVFLQRWLGALSKAHNEAAKHHARTAGGIKQTEQVKRFGLRAMTQKIALQAFSQQQNLARFNPPIKMTKPQNSPNRFNHRFQRNHSDQEVWISDDEPNEVNTISSNNAVRSTDISQTFRGAHSSRSTDNDQMRATRNAHQLQDQSNTSPSFDNVHDQSLSRDMGPRSEHLTQSSCTSPSLSQHQPAHLSLLQHHNSPNSCNNSSPHESALNCPSSFHSSQSQLAWNWKRPLMKARLRDVTNYDN